MQRGMSWSEMADKLMSYGVDIKEGSDADTILQDTFKQAGNISIGGMQISKEDFAKNVQTAHDKLAGQEPQTTVELSPTDIWRKQEQPTLAQVRPKPTETPDYQVATQNVDNFYNDPEIQKQVQEQKAKGIPDNEMTFNGNSVNLEKSFASTLADSQHYADAEEMAKQQLIFKGDTVGAQLNWENVKQAIFNFQKWGRDEMIPAIEHFDKASPEEKFKILKDSQVTPAEAYNFIGKNLFPGVHRSLDITGNVIGEQLAYYTDATVREQYNKGNTDILPYLSKTSSGEYIKSLGAATLDVLIYKFIPPTVGKAIIARFGIGGLQGMAYAVSYGLANDQSLPETMENMKTYGLFGGTLSAAAPYLVPLFTGNKAKLKTVFAKDMESLKGLPVGANLENVAPKLANADDMFKSGKITQTEYQQMVKNILNEKDMLESGLKPGVSPLIQEARKYKSAEEFVNSRINAYHGSPSSTFEKIKNEGLQLQDRPDTMNKGSGISFSTDRPHATKFTKGIQGGGVLDVSIDKDIKLVSGDVFNTKLKEIYSGPTLRGEELAKTRAAEFFKSKGYDGIDYTKSKASENIEKEIRIWSLDKIKTKSQLTDIWNKSQPLQEGGKIGEIGYHHTDEIVKNGVINAGEKSPQNYFGEGIYVANKKGLYPGVNVHEVPIPKNLKTLDLTIRGNDTKLLNAVSKKVGVPVENTGMGVYEDLRLMASKSSDIKVRTAVDELTGKYEAIKSPLGYEGQYETVIRKPQINLKSQPLQEGGKVMSDIAKKSTLPGSTIKPALKQSLQKEGENLPLSSDFQKVSSSLEPKMPINKNDEVKVLGTIRKWFTSGRKILEKSGEGGKKLARTIETQRTDEDLLRGKYFYRIKDALEGLSKKERINVGESLEKLSIPKSDKEAKAYKILQNWLGKISKHAESSGFQIARPTEKGLIKTPFKARENYFPRMYNLDELAKGAQREKSLEHLVKSGQARNKAEASKLLDNFITANAQRRAGNLEYARTLDFPGYEKDPLVVLQKYAQSVSRRFTEAEYFGMKDEKVAEMINRIAEQGGDYMEAQRIFDFTTGGVPKSKVAGAITQFNVATKLSLSAIINVTQGINTMMKAGIIKTTRGMFKSFSKAGKDTAELAGVYNDFILLKETGVDPNKLVRASMYIFDKAENFNRRVAAITGKETAEVLAKKLELNPQNAFAIRQLKTLGIDSKKLLTGKLTEDDLYRAANKMAEITQFKIDPLDIPPSWKTPLGRVLTQFKSFTFMQTKFARDEILKEAALGNMAPFVRFIVLTPLASYMAFKIYNLVKGRKEKDESQGGIDIRDFDKYTKAAGTFFTEIPTQAQFLYKTMKSDYLTPLQKAGRVVGTFLGPTAGEISGAVAGMEDIPKKKERNEKLRRSIAEGNLEKSDETLLLKRQAIEKIPYVGPYLKNKYFSFPESKKTPEERSELSDFYKFVDETRKLTPNSLEEKNAIQEYIRNVPDEDKRKKYAHILNDEGFKTTGVKLSDTTIKAWDIFSKIKDLSPVEQDKEFDKIDDPDVIRYVEQYLDEKDLTPEELDLKNSSAKKRAEFLMKKFKEAGADTTEKQDLIWDEYADKGIATEAVGEALDELENN